VGGAAGWRGWCCWVAWVVLLGGVGGAAFSGQCCWGVASSGAARPLAEVSGSALARLPRGPSHPCVVAACGCRAWGGRLGGQRLGGATRQGPAPSHAQCPRRARVGARAVRLTLGCARASPLRARTGAPGHVPRPCPPPPPLHRRPHHDAHGVAHPWLRACAPSPLTLTLT